MLLTTAAATLAATSSVGLTAIAAEQFNPWQTEIDAVFEFFDEHNFTPEERQRALYVRPLQPEAGDAVIRNILAAKVERSTYTQERIDLLLSIKHSVRQQHATDLRKQRKHLNHRWSDKPLVSVRHLMTTSSRDDLSTALLCAKIRV